MHIKSRLWAILLLVLPTGFSSATSEDVPYSLPVVTPTTAHSPPLAPDAPYTPTVLSVIRQLLPGERPTDVQIRAATSLLVSQMVDSGTCHSLASTTSAMKTTPLIAPLCFTDGLGINIFRGPNVNRTTGMPSLLALASTFDLQLANAMGQVEGREGRNLMATGLLGPQADTDIYINWARGLHTPGEDPWLNGMLTAAQVDGIQGQGLMSQVKHFAGYNGHADNGLSVVQDQALHESLLLPYELALEKSTPASIMCSYALVQDPAQALPKRTYVVSAASPSLVAKIETAPLTDARYACENPLLLTYILRDQWKFKGFVGSDYGAVHSTQSILAGLDHEDPTDLFLGISNPQQDSSKTVGILPGIEGSGCPQTGCALAEAVVNGTVPIDVLRQSLARILYQEERFGLLGCDEAVGACQNPGGINGDRSGTAPLLGGPASGAPVLGTRNGDAAIAEKIAEEGAVLLKNNSATLPITQDELRAGIAVSGGGAEYLIANPTNEGAAGFAERNAISPLQQLKLLSGQPAAFTYTPANGATGQSPACNVLSPEPRHTAICGLKLMVGKSPQTMTAAGMDRTLNHTKLAAGGQLSGRRFYHWVGWLNVPEPDTYVFRLQTSQSISQERLALRVDGETETLSDAASFYNGQYYGTKSVETGTTNPGFTEPGLRNRQCHVSGKDTPLGMFVDMPVNAAPIADPNQHTNSSPLAEPTVASCAREPTVGWHPIEITLDASTSQEPVSLRFALSRKHGDIRAAAAAARGKSVAVVFANDQGRRTVNPFPSAHGYEVSSLNDDQIELIEAVAAANANTIVVLNVGTPVIVKSWANNTRVKSILNAWLSGQEGGTAISRILLGQAYPSGHTTMTWPLNGADTLVSYDQPAPLYPEDSLGVHPERLNGGAHGSTIGSQGIFSGYRYYDKLAIPVQYPFGFGLTYTSFAFSNLKTSTARDGDLEVEFDLKNVGTVDGVQIAQVYVGAGPAVRGVQQAIRSLRGFARTGLKAGESRHISIGVDRRSFQYWNEHEQTWTTLAGPRTIWVGDANALDHLPLSGTIIIR